MPGEVLAAVHLLFECSERFMMMLLENPENLLLAMVLPDCILLAIHDDDVDDKGLGNEDESTQQRTFFFTVYSQIRNIWEMCCGLFSFYLLAKTIVSGVELRMRLFSEKRKGSEEIEKGDLLR